MIYKTTATTLAVCQYDLSYAMNAESEVQLDKILPVHHKKTSLCPDLLVATIVELAELHLPSRSSHETACKHLRAALREKAIMAAVENEKCLKLLRDGHLAEQRTFPYMFATDTTRFALCQRPLYYATSNTDPNTLREDLIRQEDKESIIYTSNRDLAIFLKKFTCATFCEPTDMIDSSHQPQNIHLNRIQLRKDKANWEEAFVRDGYSMRALPDVIGAIKSNCDNRPYQMILAQAEFQLAACAIHQDLAALAACQ